MKSIVIIQGTSGYNYAGIDVANSKFPLENYDKRVHVQTEEVFDNHIPQLLKYIPILNTLFDTFMDFALFVFKKEARKKACRMVRKEIVSLQKQGYVVDVLAHSLGTMIVMSSGGAKQSILVDNFFCYNSPISAVFGIGRLFRNFLSHFGNHFFANKIEYVYSRADLVSGDVNSEVLKTIEGLSNSYEVYNTGTTHSLKKGLDVIYKK